MFILNRRISIRLLFLVVAWTGLQPQLAPAQTVPIQELEPVIVTATRLPAKEQELTSSVTVITREEIEQQHANRVSEILERVPGLYVDEMGARGGLSSVYIRGG